MTLFAGTPTVLDLAKKAKTLDERRSYIKEALANPDLNQNSDTYYIAGEIELNAYDDDQMNRMLNSKDSTLGPKMAQELIDAYNYFLQALPYDTVVDAKGKVKIKNSKKIINAIKNKREGFFNAGVDFFNAKKLYPEAYDAFMIYGNLPTGILKEDAKLFDPQQIITAFYNAGIASYLSNEYEAAAKAYRMSRLAGNDSTDVYRFEIGALLSMIQNDNSRAEEIQPLIEEVSLAAVDKFGIQDPQFINNYLTSLINQNQTDKALEIINNYLAQYPNNANLYDMMGIVYDNMNNDELAEQAFRKGAALPDADFDTYKNASLKLFKIGTQKLNDLEGNSPEIIAQRDDLKNNYFLLAQQYANQANQLDPGNPMIQSLLDSLDYAITTYF